MNSLERAHAILHAVAVSGERLLAAESWDSPLEGILEDLGEASGAERINVSRIERMGNGGEVSVMLHRWSRPNASDGSGPICSVPITTDHGAWGAMEFHGVAGTPLWSDVEVEAMRSAANAVGAAITRETATFELAQAHADYASLVEQIPAVFYRIRRDGEAESTIVSPQTQEILGMTDAWQTTDEDWYSYVHPEDRDAIYKMYWGNVESDVTFWEAEYRWIRPDGAVIWLSDRVTVNRAPDGQWLSIQGLLFDITRRKDAELTVEHMAFHDPLTDLPNRRLFQDHLDVAIARADRQGLAVGAMFVDIDRFKELNDTRGHDIGDELLREVAARLREATRDTDIVARQGGDEFLVMLPDLPNDGEENATREICEVSADRLATSLSQTYPLSDGPYSTTTSIGVGLYPADAGSAEELLRVADEAMYACKRSAPHARYASASSLRP